MTVPTLPALGSTSWYSWGSGIHTVASMLQNSGGILNLGTYTSGGGTNDSPAIAACAADAVSKGWAVYAPAATYNIGTPITWPVNTPLIGSGWKTIFKAKSGLNDYVFITDTTLTGGCRLMMADFEIDGNNSAQTAGGCIHLFNGIQSELRGLHLHHAYDAALWIQGQQGSGPFGHHNRITNCLFDNSGGSGGSGQGLRIQAADENYVVDCDFESNGGLGTNAYHLLDLSGLQHIEGCVFVGGREGIRVSSASSTKIIGNTFDGLGGDAVHIDGSQCIITGNQFSGATGTTNSWRHVVLDNGGYNVVSNNVFWSGSTANTLRSYLSIFASAGNDSIADNTFHTVGALGSGGLVDFNGSSAGAIGVIIRNNVGLSTAGWQTAPALPASGTAYTNVLGDATVYVSGGTVTAITVDGTATGLTSGTVRVPLGKTLAITYSVAPTWKWYTD